MAVTKEQRRIYKLRSIVKTIPTKLQPGFTEWSVDSVKLGYNKSIIATVKGKNIVLTAKDLQANTALTFNVRKLLEKQLNEEAFDIAIGRRRTGMKDLKIPELTKAQIKSLVYKVNPASTDEMDRFEEWLESSPDSEGTNKKIFYHDFGAPGLNKLTVAAFIADRDPLATVSEWLDSEGF